MNPDLEKWIDEASKGLEPLARTRISEEITEHYQDALEKNYTIGLSASESHMSSIKDLGDPKIALRRYQSIFFPINYLSTLKTMNICFVGMLVSSLALSASVYISTSLALDISYSRVNEIQDTELLQIAIKTLSFPQILAIPMLICVLSLGVLYPKYMYIAIKTNTFTENYLKATILGYAITSLTQCSIIIITMRNLPEILCWILFATQILFFFGSIKSLKRYIRQWKINTA